MSRVLLFVLVVVLVTAALAVTVIVDRGFERNRVRENRLAFQRQQFVAERRLQQLTEAAMQRLLDEARRQ